MKSTIPPSAQRPPLSLSQLTADITKQSQHPSTDLSPQASFPQLQSTTTNGSAPRRGLQKPLSCISNSTGHTPEHASGFGLAWPMANCPTHGDLEEGRTASVWGQSDQSLLLPCFTPQPHELCGRQQVGVLQNTRSLCVLVKRWDGVGSNPACPAHLSYSTAPSLPSLPL